MWCRRKSRETGWWPLSETLIDAWDVATFDDDLTELLQDGSDLVRHYLSTSRQHYIDRELSDHTQPHAFNPFAEDYGRFVEAIGREMEVRSIRAWHYCRMTDNEVAALRRDGIHLSTPDTLRSRLASLVSEGLLSPIEAEGLFTASPFHSSHLESRSNKYWMVSNPVPPDDSGVELLLGHWGGEVAYFWLRDQDLIDRVAAVGRARVVELAVPMAATRHSYSAGAAVAATFARTMGCKPDLKNFDLYTKQPLGPDAVRAVYSEGDERFTALGLSFPPGSADPTVGDYDELVAEMEALRRQRQADRNRT